MSHLSLAFAPVKLTDFAGSVRISGIPLALKLFSRHA
jgi:hypothetical protein